MTEPKIVKPAETPWEAPDLADLPTDWWAQLEDTSPEVVDKRVKQFLSVMEQRITGLEGIDIITAQNGLAYIKSQFELLALAKQGPVEQRFEPPLAKETYFLDELLNLRARWRELETNATQVELQIEQSERKIRLLQDRRDKLIREYTATSPESPARILAGVNRVSARVEFELARVTTENSRKTLKQIETQSQQLDEQQAFARDHLVNTDMSLEELQKAITEANAKVTEMSKKVAALQPQLLNVLSAENVNQSLELLRKQQLTRASAEAELAQLQALLVKTKSNWYEFRSGLLDPGFDVQSATTQARRVTEEALRQADLWASASQSTLIVPSADDSLNTVKNYEIAQSAARDTLTLVDQIRSTSDDLLFVQEILNAEFISAQSGLSNTGARLSLVFGNAWDRLYELSDFHLFDIGGTGVTPAGLIKMLFILGMALGISWIIRYLLARGIRRRQAAQSPAFYALGRILHYIIVMAGSFAALGSIGIDFTSFALIAGALSVGIGFGLQAIVSNFVSGLILLFEGTLRVGDFVELDNGLRGVVKEINTRATVITTNDSVDLVVPNSVLVTTQLTNWTLRESYGRMRVTFGVAYGTDKELVEKIANEAIKKIDCALTNMPGREPQVRLSSFGDSALEFTVLFWVSRQGVRRPGRTRANFLWELETLLNENGVEIPFPQRDIHVKSDFRSLQEPGAEPEVSED
ncbi:MAG: mechanosensitive ion channel domain-containing protein [Lysobacterales bacterium]